MTNREIEGEGLEWSMIDNIPDNHKDGVFILNLDKHNQGGSHWLAVALQHPQIYYADTFGTDLGNDRLPKKDLCNWGKRNGYTEIICNESIIQPIKSSICGHMAIYLAKKLKPLVGRLTPERFDALIKREFDLKPSTYNMNKVYIFSKKEKIL